MKTRAHLPRYGVGPAYVYGVILFTAAGMWQADAAFPSGQTAGALRLGLALLTAGVIWELLVVLVCAGLLIVQPWNAVLP